jgi:hypothetical protein
MSAAKKTTDHGEIRRWVESHGGHPATVKRTRSKRDVGMIRIDFPGFSGEGSLEPIEWDDWFAKFDEQQLALIYQEGKNTNFNKLVRRDPEQVRSSDRRRGPSRTTRGGRAAAQALAAERGAAARTKRQPASAAARSKRKPMSAAARTKRQPASAVSKQSSSRKKMSASKQAQARGPVQRATSQKSARRGVRGDLHQLTKAELYERARSVGLAHRSTMNKSELIRALERQQH